MALADTAQEIGKPKAIYMEAFIDANKSVSGIRFPTEVDFKTCQLCHREQCASGKVPFDQELWELMQHD